MQEDHGFKTKLATKWYSLWIFFKIKEFCDTDSLNHSTAYKDRVFEHIKPAELCIPTKCPVF